MTVRGRTEPVAPPTAGKCHAHRDAAGEAHGRGRTQGQDAEAPRSGAGRAGWRRRHRARGAQPAPRGSSSVSWCLEKAQPRGGGGHPAKAPARARARMQPRRREESGPDAGCAARGAFPRGPRRPAGSTRLFPSLAPFPSPVFLQVCGGFIRNSLWFEGKNRGRKSWAGGEETKPALGGQPAAASARPAPAPAPRPAPGPPFPYDTPPPPALLSLRGPRRPFPPCSPPFPLSVV